MTAVWMLSGASKDRVFARLAARALEDRAQTLDATMLSSANAQLHALGWRGDNTNLTLASQFKTLAAAQAVFPSAKSLDEYLDGCCIERVIQLSAKYFGRAAIRLPNGGSRISRTINTTGHYVSIEGSGLYATQLILMTPGIALFRHGLGNVGPGKDQPIQAPFQMAKLRMTCEAPSRVGTMGLDISYSTSSGVGFQTALQTLAFHGFEQPIRVQNPGRGLLIDTVTCFGPDGTVQRFGAVQVITNQYCDSPSGGLTVRSLKVANYRYGVDVWMQAEASDGEADHRSIEGCNFSDVTAQNGWLTLRVKNDCRNADYRSTLWSITQSDGQGGSPGIYMERCSAVTVRGGYWIINTPPPPGDPENPIPDTNGERRYFDLRSCDTFALEDLRMDAAGDLGAHCLIHTDRGCQSGDIVRAAVIDYSPNAAAGFRLQGKSPNTVRETGTKWKYWASGDPRRVVDVEHNQISQTNAKLAGGTVDETGEYSLRGVFNGITNRKGNVTVKLPTRAPGRSYFIEEKPLVLLTASSANAVPSPTLIDVSPHEFTATFGASFAQREVHLIWLARGR
ncbi:hypothetical protein [Methylorubrum extorquens]|nr:hypothetical protein [Methylorubrum extorquens]